MTNTKDKGDTTKGVRDTSRDKHPERVPSGDKHYDESFDYTELFNDDGSVSDLPARAVAAREAARAATPANDVKPLDHSIGTPAWVEENTPEHMHSDGGSTVAPEAESVEGIALMDQQANANADRHGHDPVVVHGKGKK